MQIKIIEMRREIDNSYEKKSNTYSKSKIRKDKTSKPPTRSSGLSDKKTFTPKGEKSYTRSIKGRNKATSYSDKNNEFSDKKTYTPKDEKLYKPPVKGRSRTISYADKMSEYSDKETYNPKNKKAGYRSGEDRIKNKSYYPGNNDGSFKKPYATKSKKFNSRPAKSEYNKSYNDEQPRLNKYIASTGLCSRREADEHIKNGLITVNGKLVDQLGAKIKPGDDVRFNGERLKQERFVYILMNKPKDFVTTVKDSHAKKTVMEIIGRACKERVYPVGRLDKNTTGVLLLTNDGELTKKLTHPSYKKKKIYHVFLNKSVKKVDMIKITEGINLDDGDIAADSVNYVDMSDKSQIGIEIHSGRNRIVRRIFEHLGYTVRKLDRVYFAGLTKKGLQRGQWRFLTDNEIAMLKIGNYQ